jgi:23S rRNA pseudouridine1911/1915/1917 synthase
MIPDNTGPEEREPGIWLNLEIPGEMEGLRVDQALARLLPQYSRSVIQQWLRDGRVVLENKALKPSDRLTGSGPLDISIPPPQPTEWPSQPMGLPLVYSDPDLLVINKPAGLVVHPGAGNPDGTLLNGLLAMDDRLRLLPRAGIVHRLDKETSGLMVVARSERARQDLVRQISGRSVSRRYLAVTCGVPIAGETIDRPVGRHPVDRVRMAVTGGGKQATTHIRVEEKFRSHALVEARLETGRTHQIRVHLAWRGFPLVGDPLYGGRPRPPANATPALAEALAAFRRQALHATSLSLQHPVTGEQMTWEQPPPDDFRGLVQALKADRSGDETV